MFLIYCFAAKRAIRLNSKLIFDIAINKKIWSRKNERSVGSYKFHVYCNLQEIVCFRLSFSSLNLLILVLGFKKKKKKT